MKGLWLVVLVGCASEPPATPAVEKCAVSDVFLENGTQKDIGPLTIGPDGAMLCMPVLTTNMPAAELMVTTDAEPGVQSSFASELLDYNHNYQLLVSGWDVTVGDAMPMTSQHLEWSAPINEALGLRYVVYARDKPATTTVHLSLFVPLAN